MKNKGLVISLTLVITLLSVYYLSFTFVARSVQQKATAYATDRSGVVSLGKKQSYLDSMWSIPVYNFLGTEYTYKEVKENELSLGLDLQGGMHVTLEISPVEIIKAMANNTTDPAFLDALKKAKEVQKGANLNFSALFFRIYAQDNPGKKLSSIFANPATKGRIATTDSDSKIISLIDTEIEEAIDRSFTILRNRIDEFGTSQPNIQRLPGTGRIQIEIPGAENPKRVRKLLQGVARLEFFDVIDPNSLPALYSINEFLVKEQNSRITQTKKSKNEADLGALLNDSTQTETDSSTVAKGLDSLRNASVSPLFALSQTIPFRYDVADTSQINAIFQRAEIKALLPRNVGVFWSNKPDKDQTGKEGLDLYFLEIPKNNKSKLSGEVITEARSSVDERGNPAVSMVMNSTGARVWKNWTAEVSNRTPKGRVAIVLDNLVYSAPVVNGEIPNGNSQIAGNFSPEEARDLANILKAGSLPAPAKIVEEAIIGPTLGKVAQSQGMISILSGLVLVIGFMVAYYSKPGAVANLALIFNLFFILGILAQLDAALTLPGIAGVVLTMGMAVDANVIIYERIREELRQGKRLREALALGYKKSFWTIFDSNITTFLTALMLYVFGQGPIKGFAITLMVGIVSTFFTAVYISRVVIEWMIAKNGDESKIKFQTVISKFVASDLNFDFISRRKISYIFSSVFIAIGIFLIAVQGLNFGVDFTGGRSFVVNFNEPVAATDMKVALTKSFGNAGTEVKNYGGNNIVKVTTSYLTQEDAEDTNEKVKTALIEGITKFNGMQYNENPSSLSANQFTIASSSKVGATIADDIKVASFKSALFSLAVIFIYLLIRFRKWQFSTAAIISLAHDALFVLTAFAIAQVAGFSFEIDQVFVAAIMTVIGYSINDTVIIFDRIREYLGLTTSHNQPRIFNAAINSTLNRTLITSGTTLLVVFALLLFGGEVLRGFSFALLVGIGIGTYSSVFIAAPLVLDLNTTEKNTLSRKTVQKIKI